MRYVCRQFVCMCDWCSFVHTDRFPNENESKWKRNFYINADVYSQMIFIFISNTSIDIFCSFRLFFFVSLSSPLLFLCYWDFGQFFFSLLACGWFYSKLMRRMRIDTNVENCTYVRTIYKDAGVSVVGVISFFFLAFVRSFVRSLSINIFFSHPVFSLSNLVHTFSQSPVRFFLPFSLSSCSNGSIAKEEHALTNICNKVKKNEARKR